MKLREYQRGKFSNKIREMYIKDKCEICGCSINLELHHDTYFRDMLSKSIEVLGYKYHEDTKAYTKDELDNITFMMLGMQSQTSYKTVCDKCHRSVVHKNMGRPTSNPLIHDVKVRVSEETHKKLRHYNLEAIY